MSAASYTVTVSRAALRSIAAVGDAKIRARILARIEDLAENPRPAGTLKLRGSPYYRIRQGDYRIIYSIDDGVLSVEVVDVGHRSQVYR